MTPLLNIAMMDYNQLNAFVQNATAGEKYVARPSEATEIDCEICCEDILQIVIMPALKNEHKRADSRSQKVGENDVKTAELIASAALSYWQNHGFIIAQNSKLNRSISAKIKEEERAEAKREMVLLQMQTIGAILEAKKTHLKQGLQACWDFNESELILAQMNGDLSFADLAPEVSF